MRIIEVIYKKPLLLLLIFLVAIAGCALRTPIEPVTSSVPNEPPVVYIDSISLTSIFKGEVVSFKGHGTDSDGTIVAYEWRSSLDGLISTSAGFETSSLSAGNNIIYFKVQDNQGSWSKDVNREVTVLLHGEVKPFIRFFKFKPEIIEHGGASTLSWEVRGADTVKIDHDIGNVSSDDTREIFGITNAYYTLTATSEAGSVSQEARIAFNSSQVTTVETFSIIGEEGHVNSRGDIGPDLIVGEIEKVDFGDFRVRYFQMAFMSFDISMIPDGATILSSSIDITSCVLTGQPFGNLGLGRLCIFDHQYDVLDKYDYRYGEFVSAIGTTQWRPIPGFSSAKITNAVQRQVDVRSPRFQIRMQFELEPHKLPDTVIKDETDDFIRIGQGDTKLTIRYK